MNVLDASAVLALLQGEPGTETVREILDGAIVCAVNLGEIVSYYAKLGAKRADVEALLAPLPVDVIQADAELSYAAGMLRAATKGYGLSLGDRYCLALAGKRGLRAWTADRRWAEIPDLGVQVCLIR